MAITKIAVFLEHFNEGLCIFSKIYIYIYKKRQFKFDTASKHCFFTNLVKKTGSLIESSVILSNSTAQSRGKMIIIL